MTPSGKTTLSGKTVSWFIKKIYPLLDFMQIEPVWKDHLSWKTICFLTSMEVVPDRFRCIFVVNKSSTVNLCHSFACPPPYLEYRINMYVTMQASTQKGHTQCSQPPRRQNVWFRCYASIVTPRPFWPKGYCHPTCWCIIDSLLLLLATIHGGITLGF